MEKKAEKKFADAHKSHKTKAKPPMQEQELKVDVEGLHTENEKLNKQLMILAADYDNYRKRVAKDMEEASKYSISKFAKDLIEVLENLHRAESSINTDELESNNTLKQIFTGVELTKKSLIDIFERYGIVRIDPLNEQFNHDLHQAITEIPTATHPTGTIVQVIQAGYTLHGRLIRPALVAVAKSV
jgi:molecular chaperone GrpE